MDKTKLVFGCSSQCTMSFGMLTLSDSSQPQVSLPSKPLQTSEPTGWLRRKTTSQNQTSDEKRSCWSSLLCSCTELSQTKTVLERTRKPQRRRNFSASTRRLSADFLHQGKSETGPGCWRSPVLCQEPGCCSTPDPRLWKEAWRKCISEFWRHTQVLSSKSCRP